MTEIDYRVYNAIYRRGGPSLPFRYKQLLEDGAIVEMNIWAVPKSRDAPEGLRYSFVYIDADGCRALGYDNAEGKGHHRHEGKREEFVHFESLAAHIDMFLKEFRGLRGLA